MRIRVAAAAAVLLALAAVVVAGWVGTLPGADRMPGADGSGTGLGAGVAAVAWTLTGAALLVLRPRTPLGWLLTFVGTCQALQQGMAAYGGYALATGADWPAARWVAWVSVPLWLPGLLPLATVLVALYPDGRLRGRLAIGSAAAATAGIAAISLGFLLAPDAWDDIGTGPSPLAAPRVATVALVAGAVLLLPATAAIWVAAVVRLFRAGYPQRQQLAWLLLFVVPFFVGAFAASPPPLFVLWTLLLPVAVAVGVLRYGLLGIEVILRRGLVYGTLTAAVVGAYLLVTALAGTRLDRGPLPGVVTAALVAVGLTPLRDRLQAGVDRLVYGDRRDPLRAMARLGDRVAATGEADLLPAALAAVAEALRAPGVTASGPDGAVLATAGSMPAGDPEEIALHVGGRHVGTLRVGRRTPGEPFSAADRRLLSALAPQVAAVMRALDLAATLEAERDRVVAATRAERDRLRRDLHDGLGPSLSGVGLGLQALDDAHGRGDAATAAELTGRLRTEVAASVVEVRRILDDLRPAALEASPLPEALRRHADAVAAGSGLAVAVRTGDLPALPGEVEAAAFRIAGEALTNVVRHAGATRAELSLTSDRDGLRLRVADDGTGFGPGAAAGVGLSSMRERAAALGGTVDVSSGADGTTVLATIPVAGS